MEKAVPGRGKNHRQESLLQTRFVCAHWPGHQQCLQQREHTHSVIRTESNSQFKNAQTLAACDIKMAMVCARHDLQEKQAHVGCLGVPNMSVYPLLTHSS